MKHHPDGKYSFRFLPGSNLIPLDSDTSTEAEQSHPPPSPRQSQLSGAALNYYTSRLFLDKSYIKSMLADSSEPLPQWAGFACSRARLPCSASIWRDPAAQTPHCCGVHRAHRRGHCTRGRHQGKPLGNIAAVGYWYELLCCGGLHKLFSLISACLSFVCTWRSAECEFKFIRICSPIQEWLFYSHLNQPQAGDMYHTIKFQCHYKCSL